ncbi:MAG TPA: hypothetical protein VNV36_15675 [Pseudomonas sp.]|uniref:hypothetical protein n=1 Tax=Pseudomonas sp. TaxID=306 RepID=UPI002B67CBB8|nr:hypothetical protein [Pseudomonas sp.]HWH88195.1 hypothetical protein [Pseudomonas sp.]
MFVQFEDDSMRKIVAVFGCVQDPGLYPNQAEIEWEDPRFMAYHDAQISLGQEVLRGMRAPAQT